jgi:hypothetical protein
LAQGRIQEIDLILLEDYFVGALQVALAQHVLYDFGAFASAALVQAALTMIFDQV